MVLKLGPAPAAAIRRHGEETYPHECCGFLLGRSGAGGREVARLLRADNERGDSPRNRYFISPEAYLAAELEAEKEGREILGVYHSHPDHEARPSEFDRTHAFPGLSYVIVSVREGKAEEVRSWVLAADRSRFDPEPVEA
jgi:proteasome lid subunit RPN8/RPN11